MLHLVLCEMIERRIICNEFSPVSCFSTSDFSSRRSLAATTTFFFARDVVLVVLLLSEERIDDYYLPVDCRLLSSSRSETRLLHELHALTHLLPARMATCMQACGPSFFSLVYQMKERKKRRSRDESSR